MANVLIGGGTGFVGGFLSRALREKGHDVAHLSRNRRLDAEFPAYEWNVKNKTIDDAAVQQADYVINLAGAGIADTRWTKARKKVVIDSRVESTKLLAATFKRLNHQPKLYLSASATGYYGNCGDELMAEDAKAGNGFLSESCVLWEASVDSVSSLGIPVFINRTGIVLHPSGGAMQKMMLPLNFFTSTYFGDGQQWYSWIHMDDLVNTYLHAIDNQLTGVYNCVAPQPARNKTIASALPKAADKPALVIPAPAFALKLILGEMSHTILDSCKASCQKMVNSGFKFQFPNLDEALKDLSKS